MKYKKLVGGGVFKIVNNTVPLALRRLGYEREQIQRILDHIEASDTIEGAPEFRDCGAIMVRNGACYACINCGATSGCS